MELQHHVKRKDQRLWAHWLAYDKLNPHSSAFERFSGSLWALWCVTSTFVFGTSSGLTSIPRQKLLSGHGHIEPQLHEQAQLISILWYIMVIVQISQKTTPNVRIHPLKQIHCRIRDTSLIASSVCFSGYIASVNLKMIYFYYQNNICRITVSGKHIIWFWKQTFWLHCIPFLAPVEGTACSGSCVFLLTTIHPSQTRKLALLRTRGQTTCRPQKGESPLRFVHGLSTTQMVDARPEWSIPLQSS